MPALKEVHDSLRGYSQCALGANHVGLWDGLAVFDQYGPQLLADWDYPARLPLAGRVLEADGPPDLALGVVGHPPS